MKNKKFVKIIGIISLIIILCAVTPLVLSFIKTLTINIYFIIKHIIHLLWSVTWRIGVVLITLQFIFLCNMYSCYHTNDTDLWLMYKEIIFHGIGCKESKKFETSYRNQLIDNIHKIVNANIIWRVCYRIWVNKKYK